MTTSVDNFEEDINNNFKAAKSAIANCAPLSIVDIVDSKANADDLAEVATSGSYNDLTDKPTIPAAQVNADWNATSGKAQILNKPTLFSGDYDDLSNKPSLFSGSYNDLADKPTIPAAQIQADWNQTTTTAKDYIKNKPTIPTKTSDLTNNSGFLTQHQDLSGYVTKVSGKGLSTNDFTTALKGKLEALPTNADLQTAIDAKTTMAAVEAKGYQTASDVATAIANADHLKRTKVSTLPAVADMADNIVYLVPAADGKEGDLFNEYLRIDGKAELIGNSRVDFTGLATETWVNQQGYLKTHQDISGKANSSDLAEVAMSGSYNDLTDKPTIPAAQVNADWNATSGKAQILNKPTLFSGDYDDLSNKPSLFSGSYNDLTDKPTIPAAQIQADWNQTITTAKDYIKNKPTIHDATTEADIIAMGFTKNTGTITGIKMNGSSKGTSGVVDLGTVITAHQDISGKVDKTSIASSVSANSTNAQIVGAKLFYDTVGDIESALDAIIAG